MRIKFSSFEIFSRHTLTFFMLPGVAFSNSSMTSFHSTLVRSDFRWPPLFLEGTFFSSFVNLS